MMSLLANNSGLGAATISIASRDLAGAISPYQWVHQNSYIDAAVNSASVTVQFRNTANVALLVDGEHLKSLPASRCPIIAWTVNGGPAQTHQFAANEKSVSLTAGVANPLIDLYIKGMSPFEDRYSGDVPLNSVKITGFGVDDGGIAQPAVFPAKIWLNIGDSIMSGDAAAYAQSQGRPPDDQWPAAGDARVSYGCLLARHYGYRETRLAYGGYNWGGGLAKIPALSTLIDQTTSTTGRLFSDSLSPAPDVVLVNLGENGVPTEPQVLAALQKIRTRIRKSTKLFVMIPVSGRGRAEITAIFNKYKRASSDENATLIDLGPITFATADGQHPTAAGHETIFKAVVPLLDHILQHPGM